MQVILLKDVPKVGKKGDLCQVSDGYGRNFLIARGFAEIASEANDASAGAMLQKGNTTLSIAYSQDAMIVLIALNG